MEKSFEQGVSDYKANKKAQIYGAFNKGKVATPITKDEFDQEYPVNQFERYSLDALDKFRNDIAKAEDVEDKEGAFKKATEDLAPHLVYNEGKKYIVYTRKKQTGE